MPLMCCDACSEMDFKPVSLGAVDVCVCAFCKKLSTHSAIAQYAYFNPKQATSEEIVINDQSLWTDASGATEKANLGVSFQVISVFTTVRSRGMLQ